MMQGYLCASNPHGILELLKCRNAGSGRALSCVIELPILLCDSGVKKAMMWFRSTAIFLFIYLVNSSNLRQKYCMVSVRMTRCVKYFKTLENSDLC